MSRPLFELCDYHVKRFLLAAILCASLVVSVFAADNAGPKNAPTSLPIQPPSPKFAKIPEFAKGCWDFDSKLWEKADKISGFKIATGENNAPAAQQPTEIRLAHDGINFYVRFIAIDSEIAKVKTAPLDEFGDDFPRGDHAEIWIKGRGMVVFAFDSNGNKYDAQYYDRAYYSGFRVKSRRTSAGWESIVKIPMQSIFDPDKPPKSFAVSFVRHMDHGDGKVERSTATGLKPWVMAAVTIEW